MKSITLSALVALLVPSLGSLQAQSGPSANGDFQFALSGASGAIQFNAKAQGSGARGTVHFTASSHISAEDVDGNGGGSTAAPSVTIDVDVDCLRVNGNRASMSGVITTASVSRYVGLRAVLAVEDGGEGVKQATPDRFTWGTYSSAAMSWFPTDAEVPGDNGWSFSWLATDFERPDDAGVPSKKSSVIDCKSFPLGAYAFEDIAHGGGNVNVKP